jgi:methylated-DNA-[protein]-cysteine S-methyltransferase
MSEIFTSNENFLLGSSNDGKEAFAFCSYDSPVGELLFCSDSKGVAALWFAGRDKSYDDFARNGRFAAGGHNAAAKTWLDEYFSGHNPGFIPPLSLHGSGFSIKIWEMLLDIQFGKLTTYGELARMYAAKEGLAHMSAQAIGGAVGRNPVCIIIPCHRVVGAGNCLTGYREGLDRKAALLSFEGIDVSRFSM